MYTFKAERILMGMGITVSIFHDGLPVEWFITVKRKDGKSDGKFSDYAENGIDLHKLKRFCEGIGVWNMATDGFDSMMGLQEYISIGNEYKIHLCWPKGSSKTKELILEEFERLLK